MFSFHKPKVYRSTAGCCICKAKSSRWVVCPIGFFQSKNSESNENNRTPTHFQLPLHGLEEVRDRLHPMLPAGGAPTRRDLQCMCAPRQAFQTPAAGQQPPLGSCRRRPYRARAKVHDKIQETQGRSRGGRESIRNHDREVQQTLQEDKEEGKNVQEGDKLNWRIIGRLTSIADGVAAQRRVRRNCDLRQKVLQLRDAFQPEATEGGCQAASETEESVSHQEPSLARKPLQPLRRCRERRAVEPAPNLLRDRLRVCRTTIDYRRRVILQALHSACIDQASGASHTAEGLRDSSPPAESSHGDQEAPALPETTRTSIRHIVW